MSDKNDSEGGGEEGAGVGTEEGNAEGGLDMAGVVWLTTLYYIEVIVR